MAVKFPISQNGINKLKAELKNLKNIDRLDVAQLIAEARAFGDLSENAEYNAAREKQSFIEIKISELESKISRAEVIDITKIKGTEVKYGASVQLLDKNNGSKMTYKIVSDYEASVFKGLISIYSPLAKILIGKKQNELIEFKTPKGIKYYKILLVTYV